MGQVVWITGCSTGFGFHAALAFARRGERVYATMRGIAGKNAAPASELAALARAENLDLKVLEVDVTSDESVEAAASTLISESGAPDVVINNAGQMYGGIAEAFTTAEFGRQLDVNVLGIHRVTRAILPAMRQKGEGLFINVSSVAGRFSIPFYAIYCASKYAVEGYSGSLRGELASSGIDVVVVEPGPFATELFPQSPKPADADQRTASYPAVLRETYESMGPRFEQMFAEAKEATDPKAVVELFMRLAAMPAGTRNFHYTAGMDFGVSELNETTAAHQAGAMAGLGFTDLVKLKV